MKGTSILLCSLALEIAMAGDLPIESDCPRLVLDTAATVDALAENTIAGQNRVPLF